MKKRLRMSQITNIVLISMFIACNQLFRSISPVSVHSKFILVSLWIQQLRKNVCVSLGMLPNVLTSRWNYEPSSNFNRFSCINFFHAFPLPIVKISANLNMFPSMTPLKHMLYLTKQLILLLLKLKLNGLLRRLKLHMLNILYILLLVDFLRFLLLLKLLELLHHHLLLVVRLLLLHLVLVLELQELLVEVVELLRVHFRKRGWRRLLGS
jgi:hypothetical protein